MKKFYNFINKENDTKRELFIEGEIGSNWWVSETNPEEFRDELMAGNGDIDLWISSPGGDVFAAAQIYAMLKDYSGKITVKLYGMVASAATIIAMAGDTILMDATAMLYIHNPWAVSIGDSAEHKKQIEFLDEVKESIITAYELKTNLSRKEISKLMDNETSMSAPKAIELGFVDGMLERKQTSQSNRSVTIEDVITKYASNFEQMRKAVDLILEQEPSEPIKQELIPKTEEITTKSCYARLNLLTGGI
jgi:ATP-dependent Clp protease protease subunit